MTTSAKKKLSRREEAISWAKEHKLDFSKIFAIVDKNDIDNDKHVYYVGRFWKSHAWMEDKLVVNPYRPLIMRRVECITYEREIFLGEIVNELPDCAWEGINTTPVSIEWKKDSGKVLDVDKRNAAVAWAKEHNIDFSNIFAIVDSKNPETIYNIGRPSNIINWIESKIDMAPTIAIRKVLCVRDANEIYLGDKVEDDFWETLIEEIV